MKDEFFAKGAGRGLDRKSFVREVFMHLYQTTEGLHAKDDAARVVAMLDELFDQIGARIHSIIKRKSVITVDFCHAVGGCRF